MATSKHMLALVMVIYVGSVALEKKIMMMNIGLVARLLCYYESYCDRFIQNYLS